MSINNNNTNLTDIFKPLYEAGSDGSGAGSNVPVRESVIKSKATLFKGTLKTEDGIRVLYISDGGRFIIQWAKPAEGDAVEDGKKIQLKGVQNGDTIVNALVQAGGLIESGRIRLTDKHTEGKELKKLTESVKQFIVKFKEKCGLLTARPGYKFVNGAITNERAIVAVVPKKIHLSGLAKFEKLPDNFDGYDVEVIPASPKDIVRYGESTEAATISFLDRIDERSFLDVLVDDDNAESADITEAARVSNNYTPPSRIALDEVEGAMTLYCHVSPEAGWKTLSSFMEGTQEHLQIAMFDFSAPHIYEGLKDVLKNGASMKIVYDGTATLGIGKGSKEFDKSEEEILRGLKKAGGRNFVEMPAWEGKNGICYNSYHIKVAVKDKASFWLSSGNWQTSNQPNVDFDSDIKAIKEYNREWNILVDNKKLSGIFHDYIEYDYEVSSGKPEAALMESVSLPDLYFEESETEAAPISKYQVFKPATFTFTRSKPVRIQPILSPDNYIEHATEIIKSARKSLYIQNQYIKIPKEITEEYQGFLETLRDKLEEVEDPRIILRDSYSSDTRIMIEALKEFGFNPAHIKVMKKNHNKGIIADGKRILLGSHNMSNAGVQFNRDASLLIENEEVAQYYQEVFLYDWFKVAKPFKTSEETAIIRADGNEAALMQDDLKKLNWKDYLIL